MGAKAAKPLQSAPSSPQAKPDAPTNANIMKPGAAPPVMRKPVDLNKQRAPPVSK